MTPRHIPAVLTGAAGGLVLGIPSDLAPEVVSSPTEDDFWLFPYVFLGSSSAVAAAAAFFW